jgi:hypothetical protein
MLSAPRFPQMAVSGHKVAALSPAAVIVTASSDTDARKIGRPELGGALRCIR